MVLLSNRHDAAVQMLAYCAEVLAMANRAELGAGLVQKWKVRYPRHIEFQRALHAAIEKTPLLTNA